MENTLLKQNALKKLYELEKKSRLLGNTNAIREDEDGEFTIDEEACKEELNRIDEWKRETKTAISYIFNGRPKKDYYLDKVEVLEFSVVSRNEDMIQANELFREMISEIEEYWE